MNEKNTDINRDLAKFLEETKKNKGDKSSTDTALADILKETKQNKGELAHRNLVYRIISENQKWKDAQKGLTKAQFSQLNRLFQLKDYLEGKGVAYNFISDTLPTVSRGNATDDLKGNNLTINLVYIGASNQQRWQSAQRILSKEDYEALIEMFNILDELAEQGVRYNITPANDATMYLPAMKIGKADPNPVILL